MDVNNKGEKLEVPAGSVSCSMEICPTQHPKSPVIVYQQNQCHTCIFSSTASALHNYGMTEYAKYINDFSTSSLQESNIFKFFLQDVICRSPRPFNAKKAKKKGITWETIDNKYVHVAQLTNQAKDCTHTIAIYNGWIFDSNLHYAIELNKENLDWCSIGTGSLCQYGIFTGFKTLHCLEPAQKISKKRKLSKV